MLFNLFTIFEFFHFFLLCMLWLNCSKFISHHFRNLSTSCFDRSMSMRIWEFDFLTFKHVIYVWNWQIRLHRRSQSLNCNVCSSLLNQKNKTGSSLAVPPGTLYGIHISVSLWGHLLHFLAVWLKAAWKPLYDRVENPGNLCAELCFSCSTGLEFLCFHFHFSCHTLLKINVVIFITVTFVIAQK